MNPTLRSARASRRRLLTAAALGAGAAVAFPHIRTAGAAGKLSIGFWDHWVPGANEPLTRLTKEWAERTKTEVSIDYITSNGNKLRLTQSAEAQARTGHDILAYGTWEASIHARLLEPVDDVVGELVKQYGPVNQVAEYLGKLQGNWRGVPTTFGSQMKPPHVRMDLFKQHAGIDVQTLFPGGPDGRDQAAIAAWDWNAFATAAEKLNAAGHPFGLPLGSFSDAVDWVGALFRSFGAQLVNEKGDIVVRKNEGVRQVLDYMKRLCAAMPEDVFAWDDASNNRSFISGKASLICNPPSAWAVAKRDAPEVANNTWYIDMPRGPEGRYVGDLRYFWGIWNFSRNKTAAKDLLLFLSQRTAAEEFVRTSLGYDLPPFASMYDFPTWREQGPPQGMMYNYVLRDDTKPSIAAGPAPHGVASQIYVQATMTNLISRVVQKKEPLDRALAWAETEIEGFQRG